MLRLTSSSEIMAILYKFISSSCHDIKSHQNENQFCPPHLETQLLHDPRVLPRGQSRVLLGLGAGANHLARSENERRCPGLTNPHDDGGEPLRVVLRIARVQGYLLQVELAPQAHC